MSEPLQGAEGDVIAQKYATDNIAAIDAALTNLFPSEKSSTSSLLVHGRQVGAISKLVSK